MTILAKPPAATDLSQSPADKLAEVEAGYRAAERTFTLARKALDVYSASHPEEWSVKFRFVDRIVIQTPKMSRVSVCQSFGKASVSVG